MLKKRNQKGFTLIEIIAVLVILGILAAVAIPKFFDLQNEAKIKSAQAAVAAGQSAISMAYASYLLNTATPNATSPAVACQSVQLNAIGGVNYAVVCTGAGWNVAGAVSNVTGTYDDQSATGYWVRP
jgi:prepilin-type N-terminal cleavage/methylation domain-containing protein